MSRKADPPHILAVDDEPAILLLVAQILGRDGILVRTATNASQAIDHIRQDTGIAVVVIDWCMPGMNGDQLLDRLAAIRPGIRAIVLSGTYLQDVERAFSLGHVFRFLKKPSELALLLTTVRSALSEPGAGTARTAG